MWRGRVSPPANACQGSIPSDIYICYYSGKAASFGVRLMAGRQQLEYLTTLQPHFIDK